MQRRSFLKACANTLLLAALGPALTWEKALAQTPRGQDDPILVALHLAGGNDALNTLAPVKDKLYRRARPNLALPAHSTPTLEEGWALHPSLQGLHRIYENGQVAFVQGVGRPDHDRSHFRSTDIWQTAGNPEQSEGWLGLLSDRHQLASVSVGDSLARALYSERHGALSFGGETVPSYPGNRSLHEAIRRMYGQDEVAEAARAALLDSGQRLEEVVVDYRQKAQAVQLKHGFGNHLTGKRLALAARILAAQLPPRVVHVSVGSFDTHEAQAGQQARELRQLDEALTAFWGEMKHRGLDKRVVVFGYSEFGRRVEENLSGGTDHGAGGLAFFLGQKIQGGLYGTPPDLANLRDGDLPHSVDYRQLYATVLEGHFDQASAQAIVPGHQPLPGLFA